MRMVDPRLDEVSHRTARSIGRLVARALACPLVIGPLAIDPLAIGALAAGALSPTAGARSATTGTAAPETRSPAETARPPLFDGVQELRLENGMLFLLLPRHDVPSLSGRIRFRVGNVDCPAGRTGLAHMFEHLAFQGTDDIGTTDRVRERAIQDSVSLTGSARAREIARRQDADSTRLQSLDVELERLIERQRAFIVPMEFPQLYDGHTFFFNAWTSPDFTEYTTDLPSNNLEVWMLMESERIQHPAFREFYPELEVVKEERRQNTDDDPLGRAWELFYLLAFSAHPYRYPTIGFMSELELLTDEEAERFYRTYYVPSNAVAVLVGDFDPAEARRLADEYFGDIPAGPPPPEIGTVEPEQRGQRRGVVRQGSEHALMLGFAGFPVGSPEWVAAGLLSELLARDDTSRLTQRLELREKAVREIVVNQDGGYCRYPGVFEIFASVQEGFTNEEVEALIWEELDRMTSDPPAPRKLEEIKSSHRKRYFRALETNSSLADELIQWQTTRSDWRSSYRRFDIEQAVSMDDIVAVARGLFQRDRTTVVYLEPEDSSATSAEGGH